MKRYCAICVEVLAFSLLTSLVGAQMNDFPVLTGPYLGQKPPGLMPQIFADEITGAEMHGCPVFTADGLEAYWSVLSTMKIVFSRVANGRWIEPVELTLPPEVSTSDVPCLSTDGSRLFFVAKAPIDNEARSKENIWFMDRDGDGWTAPQPLSKNVNSKALHWQISVAENGNLYFSYMGPEGIDIALSRFIDGHYSEPEVLGGEINKPSIWQDFAPFVAPDESYLIFARAVDESDGPNPYADLYISFRSDEGVWTQAVPMEGINTDDGHQMCANVTRDGKYLFFLGSTRSGLNALWVSSEVIEDYRR